MTKDPYGDALPEIKWRDEVAVAAMRSLLLVAAKTEPMMEIAIMAYKMADAMLIVRGPGVDEILEVHKRLDPKPRQRIRE